MANITIKDRRDLDALLTLAPERYAMPSHDASAARIADVASFAGGHVRRQEDGPFVALDTTHAVDGLIALRPLETTASLRSNKKRIECGDVLISRLRPYLRQVAYVDRALCERFPGATLCCSTEFYVLRAREGASLAFLVPFLLGETVQTLLARAQEGGHHPRVPSATIAALRIPGKLLAVRAETSKAFAATIQAYRQAERTRDDLIARASTY